MGRGGLPRYEEVEAVLIRSDIKLGGATGARVMGCQDGKYYVCKSLSSTPFPQPYLLANEQISKNLADLLSLPTQPSKVVNLKGELLFGSEFDSKGRDIKSLHPNRWDVGNWHDIPNILVFDIFVCNIDRHLGNSLAASIADDAEGFIIKIVDHSHALMGNCQDRRADLQNHLGIEHYLRFPEINALIENLSDFEPVLTRLEGLKRDEIEWAVRNLPPDWLPYYNNNSRAVAEALFRRKGKVRVLLADRVAREEALSPIRRLFPNLRP